MKRVLLFVVAFAVIVNWQTLWGLAAGGVEYDAENGPRVELFVTSWCGYCAKTRRYFKMNNIPYVEFDIEKSADAYRRYATLGGRGVPVVKIGEAVIHGYNPPALKRALEAG